MKKILLLIITFTLSFNSYAQFPEDFSGTTFPPAGWDSFENGTGAGESWQKFDNNGTILDIASIKYENVDSGTAEDWLVTPQFTVDAATSILSFDQADIFSTDYGSVYTVRVSTASQNTPSDFTIVDTQGETDMTAGSLSVNYVDLTAYAGQTIYVAFVMVNDDGDYWLIDNIDMIADANAPDAVSNPTPADGAVDVDIDETDGDADGAPDMSIVFSWDAATTGDPATTYEFYLVTTAADLATATPLAEVSDPTITIINTTYDTTYYWKVIAKNVGGSSPASPDWSFTTEATPAASIKDDVLSSSILIYPNVTTDNFTIKNTSTIALTDVTLFDINGRVVLSQNLNNLIGEKSINVSNLSAGIYFIEINSTDVKITRRLIKK